MQNNENFKLGTLSLLGMLYLASFRCRAVLTKHSEIKK